MTPMILSAPQERILSAAKQVFATAGFRGGSLNDVAVMAGYTRAGLLHHYPSKEAMLLALLDLRDEQLDILCGSEDERRSIFTLVEHLPAQVLTILEDRVLIELAHSLSAEATTAEHPAYNWVLNRQERVRSMFSAAVAHSIDDGELPASVDPHALAAVLLAVIEGLETQWLVGGSADPVKGIRAFGQLLEGLRLK